MIFVLMMISLAKISANSNGNIFARMNFHEQIYRDLCMSPSTFYFSLSILAEYNFHRKWTFLPSLTAECVYL